MWERGWIDGWITSCGVTSVSSLHFWATCHFFCMTLCKSFRKSLGGVTAHPGELSLPSPTGSATGSVAGSVAVECCFMDDFSGSRRGSVGGSVDLHSGSSCADALADGLCTSRSSNVIRRFFLLGLLFDPALPHSGGSTGAVPLLPLLTLLPAKLQKKSH